MYLLLAILALISLVSPSDMSPSEVTFPQEFEKELNFLKMRVEKVERSETDLKLEVENMKRSETDLKRKVEMLERSGKELKEKIENLELIEEQRKKSETSMRSNGNKSPEEKDTFLTPKSGNDTEERLTYLEELSKTNLRRNCHELAQYGVNIDNYYYVDPDGELVGAAPIRVWCEFSEGSSITHILHNSEENIAITHCHDPACYKRDIVYSAPDYQIQSLIQLSENCEQSIEYNCLMAPLQKDGVNFGYWLDNQGERMDYWTGANYGQHVCGCFFTEEGCLEESTTNATCNCDAIVPELMSDVGVLRNMSALPVTQLQFGGLSYDMQSASHQLGRLKCWGQKNYEAGTSCAAIRKAGEFRSGFYNVKESEETNSKLVFCKSSPGYSEDGDDEIDIESSEDHFQSVELTISGIEVDITEITNEMSNVGNQVSILQDNVEDLMKRSDYCGHKNRWTTRNHVVTYDKLIVENNHNAPGSTLDIQTGEFKAGVSGLYQIDVSMWTYSTDGRFNDIYLRRNGVNIAESHMVTSHDNYDMGGRRLMIQLDHGDTLSLYYQTGGDHLDNVIFCIKLAK